MSTEQTQEKKPGVIDRVLGALRDIFAPNLIALMAAGILQGIVILLNTFGIISPENKCRKLYFIKHFICNFLLLTSIISLFFS